MVQAGRLSEHRATAAAMSRRPKAPPGSLRSEAWRPRPQSHFSGLRIFCVASFWGRIGLKPAHPRIRQWTFRPFPVILSPRRRQSCGQAVSSRGLGRSPLKAETRVRIPLPLFPEDVPTPPSSSG